MKFDDWLISLHVVSAFLYVGALVLFWVLVVVVRKTDTPDATIRLEPSARVGNVAVGIGSVGTIVFGVWLAFSLDRYDIWDGWIVAAIVLWAVAFETGRRAGTEYSAAFEKAKELVTAGQRGPSTELLEANRTQRGLVMHAVSTVLSLLILIDMVWKPGA